MAELPHSNDSLAGSFAGSAADSELVNDIQIKRKENKDTSVYTEYIVAIGIILYIKKTGRFCNLNALPPIN